MLPSSSAFQSPAASADEARATVNVSGMAKKAAAVAVISAIAARPLLAASGYGGTSNALSNSGSTDRDRSLGYALLNKLSLVKHNEFMDLDTCTPTHLNNDKKRQRQNVIVHMGPRGGHACLTIGDKYLNYYPQTPTTPAAGSSQRLGLMIGSKTVDGEMLHPRHCEIMKPGAVSIELPFIDGKPILEFIKQNAGENPEKYSLFSNNCATMVAKALMSSTKCRPAVDPTLGDHIFGADYVIGAQVWTPEKVIEFAKELTALAGEPLRENRGSPYKVKPMDVARGTAKSTFVAVCSELTRDKANE